MVQTALRALLATIALALAAQSAAAIEVLAVDGGRVVLRLTGERQLAPGTVLAVETGTGPARVQLVVVTGDQAVATLLEGEVTRGLRPQVVARPLSPVRLRVRLQALPTERGMRTATQAEVVWASLRRWPPLVPADATEPADRTLSYAVEADHARLVWGDLAGGVLAQVDGADIAQAVNALAPTLDREILAARLRALTNPRPPFGLTVRDPRGERATYAGGETLVLETTATADCFLTLLSLGATGQLTVLLPNRARPSQALRAGERVVLPDPAMGFTFRAAPPAGEQLVKALATRAPLDLPELRCEGLGERWFRRLDAAAASDFLDRLEQALTTRVRDFDVVADHAWATAALPLVIAP